MTRRRRLPKWALGDIDYSLMCNENAVRIVLILARLPGSDGRLADVLYNIHESSTCLKRAIQRQPVTVELIMKEVGPILDKYIFLQKGEVVEAIERALKP